MFPFRQRANVAQLVWAAGGRSAGAGGIEPASGAPATLSGSGASVIHCFVDGTVPTGKPPAGAARGGDGEHGNEQRSAAQCEPRAASAAGPGRGR
ncbi:conserved protein of unknown function [Xenorhabdus doucetiae]|uniref:Uncharacterized protein n=1 Tax=Xenorhabdus doucetiae TaxID=351671 RepID=A0A068QSA5_9GAMM|nr:conserved protein of unknown function [Xenorhabdus doucetiae]